MPSPIRKTTPAVARQYLEMLSRDPPKVTSSMRVVIQIVRGIRDGTILPADMRGRVDSYREVLQDPVLRAAVYRVLDKRAQRGAMQVDKWRVGFRINGSRAPNGGRRRPPSKFRSR